MADAGCKCVVMEVSSQGLMLNRTGGFTFDYGIFTNLEPDHIGPAEHKDLADYIHCKSLLFRHCRHGIFNADDGYYYYAKALVKDESTVDLMNGLTLCEDTDMGHFVDKGYFTIGAKNLPSDEAAKLQPELKADGSLADGVTGWYELNADGTVPTKK